MVQGIQAEREDMKDHTMFLGSMVATFGLLFTAASCAMPSSDANGKHTETVTVAVPTGSTTGSTTTSTTTSSKAKVPAKVVVGYGQGTYLIPEDMKPGVYRSKGGDLCYWERQRDGEGGLNSIISNDASSGPQVVTIKKTDWAFKTSGCSRWVLKK